MSKGATIHVTGIVQGVGFRPWVWKTASLLGLSGTVRNSLDGVWIELDGAPDSFLQALNDTPPPLARIDAINVSPNDREPVDGFTILESDPEGEALLRISPDVALCDECRRELFNPADRRYRYPFINCVNCGPRFSIIEQLPYDRPHTSMRAFEMCPACRKEYTHPDNRRYHAQPIACPDCGPSMEPANWEAIWRESMEQGAIVAVKGVGGFHLACDALNTEAVARLRERKGREAKPFALMVPNLDWVRSVCLLAPEEERLLCSTERPIVLLKIRNRFDPFDQIAPGLDTLGVMLPYSPMHEIMFNLFPHPVVMTSANYSSEPMIHTNEDARKKLGGMADRFLMHNREIANRCDDPVCAVYSGQTMVLRPGRGVAPVSIPLARTSRPSRQGGEKGNDACILALGADMKNTFALAHHGQLTMHSYIGDLEHPEIQGILDRAIQQQLNCFQLNPDLVVHDRHPDYFSTQIAIRFAAEHGIPVLAVQHHHAHLAGAYPGKAIGFAFDGTGYGSDGTIWGGEVLVYDAFAFSREFHLRPFALPGGDAAVKNPRRVLESLLYQCDPARWVDVRLREQLSSGINCPATTSMGRLFDAVSCLLGVCTKPTYDGEAAMRLEAVADPNECGDLAFEICDGEIDWRPLILDLIDGLDKGIPVTALAGRFHNTVAEVVYCCGKRLAVDHPDLPWVFSGGVFQNRLLVDRIRKIVGDEYGLFFSTYPNDSGIAIGQAMIGAKRWASK